MCHNDQGSDSFPLTDAASAILGYGPLAPSRAATVNAEMTAARASIADPKGDGNDTIDLAVDRMLGRQLTPAQLQERRFRAINTLLELQGKLGELAQQIAGDRIDSNAAMDQFIAETGRVLNRLGPAMGVLSSLARDIRGAQVAHHERPFANGDRFRIFNGG